MEAKNFILSQQFLNIAPMNTPDVLLNLLSEYIKKNTFDGTPGLLYEPLNYTFDLGGKRLRPLLLLMACEMVDGDLQNALDAAMGIELFHNFTLLHDDIMDNAPLRRGKPTVHARWNSNTAILSGDVMFVFAYKYIAKVPASVLVEVLEIFNNTAREVCEGQQWDMIFEQQQEVEIDQYINMIRLKTAVLLGASLQIGALAGGGNREVAGQLYEYGVNMGIAFQLQDDILDTFGDPQKFGKKVGGDIAQNKKTYLLLKAFEKANDSQKIDLQRYLGSGSNDGEKISGITAIFRDLKIREDAVAVRDHYFSIAGEIMSAIELPEERKQQLVNFASSLMQRES